MNYIDSGSVHKTGPTKAIAFNVTFEKPPIVLVSPFWDGAETEVGHAETIDKISQTGCVLVSGNATPSDSIQPYKVNWVAIGVQEKKD
jgi:hypothetical protein